MSHRILWRLEHAETGLGPLEHYYRRQEFLQMKRHYLDHQAPGPDGTEAIDARWTALQRGEDGGCTRSWFFAAISPKALADCFQDFAGFAADGFRLRVYAAEDAPRGRGEQAIFRKAEARLLCDLCPTSLLSLDQARTAPQALAA